MDKSWSTYYKNTKSLKPSKYLIDALSIFEPTQGDALDLGCGAGRDTRYLLEKGYAVTAVDKDPDALHYLSQLPNQHALSIVCCDFTDFHFKDYVIVNAHYSLPFVGPVNFKQVMTKTIHSIKPGGLFVGQLFGIDDERNNPSATLSFSTRHEVEAIFKDFDTLQIDEVNEKGLMAMLNTGTFLI